MKAAIPILTVREGDNNYLTEAITATPGIRVINGRPVPEPGTREIDPSHQSFEFVARHLMAKVRGKFSDVSGAATVAEGPEESSLEIEIDTTPSTPATPPVTATCDPTTSSASRTTPQSASAAPASGPGTARPSGRSTGS